MKELPENPLRKALADGRTVVGTLVQDVRDPFIMQVLAEAGLDYAIIDMEHGPIGIESASTLIQVGRLAGLPPIVRVPDAQYHLMCPLLDAGAMGVMIPRLSGPAEVKQVIQCVKYPPWGRRGVVGRKGQSNYRVIDPRVFLPKANEELMVFAQIELRSAVEQIEEILSIAGVDVAFVGPADLSVDLGVPGQMDHPTEVEAIEKVVAACRRRGVASGIAMGDVESIKTWRDKGVQVLCCGSESGMLSRGFRQVAADLRP